MLFDRKQFDKIIERCDNAIIQYDQLHEEYQKLKEAYKPLMNDIEIENKMDALLIKMELNITFREEMNKELSKILM